MSMFPLRAVALAAALLPALTLAAPLSLEQALHLAVQRSESARASRAGVASAREVLQPAGELPDPMLSLGVENVPVTGADRFSTTREGMTMKRIALAQEWVSGEKRSARRAAAAALVARCGRFGGERPGYSDPSPATLRWVAEALHVFEQWLMSEYYAHIALEVVDARSGAAR